MEIQDEASDNTITAPPPGQAATLNAREKELLRHLANGRTLTQAAAVMRLAAASGTSLLRGVRTKTGAHTRADHVRVARQLGLVR